MHIWVEWFAFVYACDKCCRSLKLWPDYEASRNYVQVNHVIIYLGLNTIILFLCIVYA